MTTPEGYELQTWKGDDGLWRWHIRAGNGEIVAQGEGYEREDDMVDNLRKLWPDLAPQRR